MPHAHVSLITLGASDIARSARFYETLGFARKVKAASGDVAFFSAGGIALSLFRMDLAAKDAAVADTPLSAFRGVTVAWNCESRADVDAVMAQAAAAGATVTKSAQEAFWGGYHGFFADPDGHLWEIAHNPHFPLSADGTPILPD